MLSPDTRPDSSVIQALVNDQQQTVNDLQHQITSLNQKIQKDPLLAPKYAPKVTQLQTQLTAANTELANLNRSLVWCKRSVGEIHQHLHDLLYSLQPRSLQSPTTPAVPKPAQPAGLWDEMNGLTAALNNGWLDPIYLGPYAILYQQSAYQGQGWIIAEDVQDSFVAFPKLASIRVSSGVTIFRGMGFQGTSQDLYTDIPQLDTTDAPGTAPSVPLPNQMTRLGNIPHSIRVWSAEDKAYTGGWAVQNRQGTYLSAAPDGLHVAPQVADREVFMFDTVGTPQEDRRTVTLQQMRIGPDGRFDKRPVSVNNTSTFTLVNEKALGARKFSLMSGSQWLTLSADGHTYQLTDDPNARDIFTLAIKVAADESQVGELLPGEVALYENRNYWGRVWVLYQQLRSFNLVNSLDNIISSIRLAPNTGATIFRDSLDAQPASPTPSLPWGFKPVPIPTGMNPYSKQDVFENIPSLADSQVGDNQISAMSVWRIVEALDHTCSLTQDYREVSGKLEDYSAYRVTIDLANVASSISVWTTDLAKIESGGTIYTTDEQRSTTLTPGVTGSVVLTLEATSLACPALKIKTDTMANGSYFLIYPDSAAHKRIQKMDSGALWSATDQSGKRLVNQDKYSASDAQNVQSAVQAAIGSIQYGATREISTANFQDSAWLLDFGTTAQPASVQKSLTPGVPATPPQPSSFKWLSDAELQQIQDQINAQGGSLQQGVLSGIGDFFKDPGNTINQVIVQPIEHYGKEALQVIVKGAKDIGVFVLDTVDKVVDFVNSILEYIKIAIDKFIEWLQFLFGWDDILHTQDVFVQFLDQALNYTKDLPKNHRQDVQTFFANMRTTLLPSLATISPAYGVGEPSSSGGSQADFMEEAIDKIHWALNKLESVLGADDGFSSSTMSAELQNFWTLLTQESQTCATAVAAASDKLSDYFDDLVEHPEHAASLPGAILAITQPVIDAVLQMMEKLAMAFLDIMADLGTQIESMLTAHWNIPFFSDLYKLITEGDHLSVLNLTTLIVAIPVTIIAKATTHHAPFAHMASLSQSSKDDEENLYILSVTSAVSSLISSIIAAGLDLVPEETAEDAAENNTGKTKEAVVLGILEGVTLILGGLSWACGKPSTNHYTGMPMLHIDTGEIMGRVVWLFEGSLLLADIASILVAGFKTKHPTSTRRLPELTGFETGPWLGSAIGLAHLGLIVATIEEDSSMSEFDQANAIMSVMPEVFALARHTKVATKTNYKSVFALSTLDLTAGIVPLAGIGL